MAELQREVTSVCIEVAYRDQSTGHFAVPKGEGWKIDAALRLLVVGRGVTRKIIPLDNVDSIEIIPHYEEGSNAQPTD